MLYIRSALLLVSTLLVLPEDVDSSRMTWNLEQDVMLSQTMFARTSRHSTSARPYIEFKVTCTDDVSVSYILVAAPSVSVGKHNITSAGPETASCEKNFPNETDTTSMDTSVVCDEKLSLQEVGPDGEVVNTEKEFCCNVDTWKPNTKKNSDANLTFVKGSYLLFDRDYVFPSNKFITGKRFNCIGGELENEGGYSRVTKIPFDGWYTLYIQGNLGDGNTVPKSLLSGFVDFVSLTGYLPAGDYPLLVFYGIMGLVYLFIGMIWLGSMAYNYKDLLRLQFWLAAVIFLGMIEFAFAYGDLDWLNSNGTKSMFLFVTTQLLHAGKSTTARILVLVVSMGYGVVKPRLGAAFKQVVVFGFIYMIMASMYGITHIPPSEGPAESKYAMITVVPLAVLDAGVLWWIFFSLHHTMKILSLRQNTVKLLLYQRFRLLLAFFAIGAILFFGWTVYNSWDTAMNHAWENAWLLEAFQHILFSIVLVGILVLWRPSMNNSRYAYAHLETDLLEDDNDRGSSQVVPNFGQETMTSRSRSSRGLKPPAIREPVEDELQWVEDNIPSTALSNDNTLASLQMDSDEDIMETRILMNKME